VVLPFPVEDYVTAMVAPAGVRWRERFEECLARASSLTVLAQKPPPARDLEAAFTQSARYAAGQALLKADALMADCVTLAAGAAQASMKESPGPCRPVVFAWLLRADGGDSQLSARGISDEVVEATEALLRETVGPHTFVLRRLLGGNRPQCALVALPPAPADAIAIAERLLQSAKLPRVGLQITLDFGPVLAGTGQPHEDRLKDLDMGGGPLEVPDSALVASAAFTMEARLALGATLPIVALGRVARLESAAGAVPLLPSTEIYAVASPSSGK
jgi:hypothetical protein